MKRADQDRLLRDVLGDTSLSAARDAALASGLKALRGRRRRRALLTGTSASLAVAAVVALLVHRRVAPPPSAAPREIASTSAPAPSVKMIDDAQLLALFPDRPVALIGAPGEQRLVFLDVLPAEGNSQIQ